MTTDNPLPPRPPIVVPDDWTILPNFTSYALSPLGDVYRIKRASRGRYSDIEEPAMIRPSCHPRGLKWYVQLTSDSGKRFRVDVARVKELVTNTTVDSQT